MTRLPLLTLMLIAAFGAAAQDRPEPRGVRENPEFVLDEKTRVMLDRRQSFAQQGNDGRVHLNTQGGHQHVYMARIGKDGRIETYCAEHALQAEKFLSGEALQAVPK